MSFLHNLINFLRMLDSRFFLKIFEEKVVDILICAFSYLFEDSCFYQFLSLLIVLLRDEWMRDENVIEEDRNTYKRDSSRDCDNEIENGVLNVDIECLFDNKSW